MHRWLPISEQFVYGLVTRSRRRGVVVSRHKPNNREAFPFRPIISLNAIPNSSFRLLSERRMLTISLSAIARTMRADLVHVHHGYNVHDVEGFVRRRRLPLVISFHGEDLIVMRRRYGPDVFHSVLSLAEAVIVPSNFLAGHAFDAGARSEIVHVIPSGVDLTWFSPTELPSGDPEILFVGRFVEKKGIDVLLRAWPAVRERVPAASLRLLGQGPLEDLARSGGDGVTVEPTDPLRRAEQIRDAIRRARVVVTPSKTAGDGDSESLLLVNLEAQAAGRPLVTTRHGGIPEYVAEGETALLVPENDAEALAEALVRATTDESLAARMAEAGPRWAAEFDVRACTARVDDLYDALSR